MCIYKAVAKGGGSCLGEETQLTSKHLPICTRMHPHLHASHPRAPPPPPKTTRARTLLTCTRLPTLPPLPLDLLIR